MAAAQACTLVGRAAHCGRCTTGASEFVFKMARGWEAWDAWSWHAYSLRCARTCLLARPLTNVRLNLVQCVSALMCRCGSSRWGTLVRQTRKR